LAKSGLIVSYYFPPVGGGGVQRWVKLIKYLKNFDWQFSVISGTPEANQPTDHSLVDDIPGETKIIRLVHQKVGAITKSIAFPLLKSGYWQRWISALLNITDSRQGWNQAVREKILQELSSHHYDVLIFSAPPYSLAELAAEFGERLSIPVIFDLRDPWTINPYKIHPTSLHRFLDRQREFRTISRINAIISAYRCIIENYSQRIPGFIEKQIQFLPNGYDDEDFTALEPVELKNPKNFKMGFSGSFYSHLNTPDFLFAAMKELEKKDITVDFHHVGTSVYNLKAMSARYGIEKNVIEWGYQPHRRCLEILSQMDALCLILDDRRPHSVNTIGGKFYEYLRLKKPIIALVPEKGEAAAVVRETDSGMVISGQHAGEIARQLEVLIAGKKRFAWRDIDQYSRQNQALILDSYLSKLIMLYKDKNRN